MWMAGAATGNIVRLRFDVREEIARDVEALATREPPMSVIDAPPVHLDEYIQLLSAEAPVEEINHDLTYLFADVPAHTCGVRKLGFVRQGRIS